MSHTVHVTQTHRGVAMLHIVLSLLTGRFDVHMLACCTVRQSVAAASSGEGLSSPAPINLRV